MTKYLEIIANATFIVISLVFCLTSPTFAADFCDINIGICQIQDAVAEVAISQDCQCKTVMGQVSGKKIAQDTEVILLDQLMKTADIDKLQIQIYSKKTDEALLREWVGQIDSKNVNIGTPNPVLANESVNAILFSSDVSIILIKLTALSLIDKGVHLKSIQLYEADPANGRPSRSNLIQIGSLLANRKRMELSKNQVATSALPMFGELTR